MNTWTTTYSYALFVARALLFSIIHVPTYPRPKKASLSFSNQDPPLLQQLHLLFVTFLHIDTRTTLRPPWLYTTAGLAAPIASPMGPGAPATTTAETSRRPLTSS